MKYILLAGVAAAALAGSVASADPAGPYIAGELGWNWKSDQNVKSDATTGVAGNYYRYKLSTKDNFTGVARLGYRFDPRWRVELEGAYRPGDIDKAVGARTFFPGDNTAAAKAPDNAIISSTGTAFSSPHGHIDQTSLMANLVRDFAPAYRFHPYLGLGVGFDSVNGTVTGKISRTGQTISLKGNKVEPAIQGLAGVSYSINPRLTLEVGYRLMYTGKMKYRSTVVGPAPANLSAPGDFSGSFDNQSVTVGLRYAFGHITPPAPETTTPMAPPPMAPPPPPPPPAVNTAPVAPPVPEAKTFVVYFRFDRSSLTPDAKAVVQAAADYANSGKATKIVVVGYTDTSGSKAYNLKLSARRAKSTASALAADGVNKSILSLDWKGENDLAKPTPDGVKEPANRRSTIDVMF